MPGVNSQHHLGKEANLDVRRIVGSFVANGTDDPDTSLTKGARISTITHDATGTFTVTLDGTYPRVVAPPRVWIQCASPAAKAIDIIVTAETITTDGAFTFVYREDHVAADRAANTSTRFGFEVVCQAQVPHGST